MDTNKLKILLSSDQFYKNFSHSVRELYTESYIASRRLLPPDVTSFQKIITTKITKESGTQLPRIRNGIAREYNRNDLTVLVESTNNKYEEFATGNYTEFQAEKGMRKIRDFSTILYKTLYDLGYNDIADQLKYVDRKDEETKMSSMDKLQEAFSRVQGKQTPKADNKKEEDSKSMAKKKDDKIVVTSLDQLNEVMEAIKDDQSSLEDIISREQKNIIQSIGKIAAAARIKEESIPLPKSDEERMEVILRLMNELESDLSSRAVAIIGTATALIGKSK